MKKKDINEDEIPLGKKRENAIERYLAAYKEYKETEGADFMQCLINNGCSPRYPLMKIDEFPPGVDIKRAISDMIGFTLRISNKRYNEPYIEAIAEFCIRYSVRAVNVKMTELSDEDLVRELIQRGIKGDRCGGFYKEKIVRVPINIDEETPSES